MGEPDHVVQNSREKAPGFLTFPRRSPSSPIYSAGEHGRGREWTARLEKRGSRHKRRGGSGQEVPESIPMDRPPLAEAEGASFGEKRLCLSRCKSPRAYETLQTAPKFPLDGLRQAGFTSRLWCPVGIRVSQRQVNDPRGEPGCTDVKREREPL